MAEQAFFRQNDVHGLAASAYHGVIMINGAFHICQHLPVDLPVLMKRPDLMAQVVAFDVQLLNALPADLILALALLDHQVNALVFAFHAAAYIQAVQVEQRKQIEAHLCKVERLAGLPSYIGIAVQPAAQQTHGHPHGGDPFKLQPLQHITLEFAGAKKVYC